MKAWLENLVGPDYASALLWTIVALIVLLVLLVLIRIARSLSIGTFVSGGRNRKARLAVMDATAVDSHRRLVLVRRDDVEHLILIGGPTDVVVEQNIRLASPTRRAGGDEPYPPHFHDHPHAPEEPRAPRHAEPAPRPAAPPRPTPPQPVSAPVAALTPARPETRPSQPAAVAHGTPSYGTPAAPRPVPAPAAGIQPMRPVVASAPAASTAPHVAPPVHKPDVPKADLDDALAKELEVTLDKEVSGAPRPQPAPAPQPAASASLDDALDEEMSKLLSDLAGKR
ncbi:MAG: flagellar biosynthetic protein FliO [Aquamicrobium sp.]|uniref:hypothetical protein n=1 Tax=Aquamicrobium sp. TaxID=1872579 RepID=UPI00349EBB74|nr:flagellar biosynthetic protein FliO [Aquamicrobium sp.]